MRFLAWLEIAVPTIFLVVTFPGGFIFLLFGGIIIVAPLYALGILGLRLGRSLRHGRRKVASSVLAIVQGLASIAIAVHSSTWDADTGRGRLFFVLVGGVCAVGGTASLAIPPLLASARLHSKEKKPQPREPGDLELEPPLWPWVVGALLVLALVVLGIWVPASQ